MKLLILTKKFGNYTGATISTIEILRRIKTDFESIDVLTLETDGTRINGINIKVMNGYNQLLKKLKFYSKNGDVIGYSDDHLGFLFHYYGIKYLHTYHGNWPDARTLSVDMFLKSFYFIPLYKSTIKHAQIVVSVSNYMRDRFVNRYNSNAHVIYNGIKTGNLQLDSNSEQFNNRFLMVGNIDRRKYGKALKIFKLLDKKNFKGSIDIYGKSINRNIVEILNKFEFVNLKGQVSTINYRKYSALLCSSISENLPVSIVEALLGKIPVISFNVGGISEVIINNKNGFLIEPFDAEKFVNQILYLKLKKRDLNFNYKEIFDWDNSAKLYESFFEKLE